MLKLNNIEVSYLNVIRVLHGVSFQVEDGSIVALLGANGAGKSTTLRTIQGILSPKKGTILLDGEALEKLPPHKIVERGISQSPEGRLIFPRMTVQENLEMGAYSRKDKTGIAKDFEWVFNLFPRLKERIDQKGGTLSGGEQQMLAIGRAMMAHPRIMLLDEPSMGLAPILVEQIFTTIVELNKQGTTILLVEQNARMALSISNRGYVLQTGEIILHDTSARLKEDPMVQKSYLGAN